MKKIKVYFIEITDLNGTKWQKKSTDYSDILSVVRQHRGKIAGINKGSRLVSEEKFKEIQREENFR